MKVTLPLAIIGFFLSACTLSLAGDITPPPETESEQLAFQFELPSAVPDLAFGAAIYAENCAPCHGVLGLGDGAQGAQLAFPPAALSDPELARDATPQEWLQMVASGNLNRHMPPFSGSLSLQEIWDVTAYAFSLGWDENALEGGVQIYADHQRAIEESSLDPGDFEQYSQMSRSDIGAGVSVILPDLDPFQVEALAEYLQSVTLGYAVAEETVSTDSTENAGAVSGKVVNGSGSPLPNDLQVTLRSHLSEVVDEMGTVNTDSNGTFLFENLPLEEGRAYFAQVEYDGLLFFSELATVEEIKNSFNLPVIVYDTTSDTSQLVTEYVHFVFEFLQPGVMRVVEQIGITNLGNLAVVPGADGEPALLFSLPREASQLEFSDGALGDRFVGAEGGFGDMRAVMPGEDLHQILLAYELPYTRGVNIEIPVDRPTRNVVAFIPETDTEFAENSFQLIGRQAIEGEIYRAYAAQDFAPGEVIRLAVSGSHPLGQPGISADADLLFGLGALTAAVGAGWLWLRSLPDRRPALTPDQIIDQIIELDYAFEAGQFSKTEHERRRSLLKKQLNEALRSQS